MTALPQLRRGERQFSCGRCGAPARRASTAERLRGHTGWSCPRGCYREWRGAKYLRSLATQPWKAPPPLDDKYRFKRITRGVSDKW